MNTRWTSPIRRRERCSPVVSPATAASRCKREDPTEAAAKYQHPARHRLPAAGQLRAGREKLERSLKQNPKDPDVHTSLGLLYDRTGEPKLADKHYQRSAAARA